jgi:biotin operon repressor
MDGWSQGEISRMLGISKQAVSKHVVALKVQPKRHRKRTVQP